MFSKLESFTMKSFRRINIILLIISIYIFIKSLVYNNHYSEIIHTKFYDTALSSHEILPFFFITIILTIVLIGLCLFLKKRDKPWKLYLIPIFIYLSLLIIFGLVYYIFSNYSSVYDSNGYLRYLIYGIFHIYLYTQLLAICIFTIKILEIGNKNIIDPNESSTKVLNFSIILEIIFILFIISHRYALTTIFDFDSNFDGMILAKISLFIVFIMVLLCDYILPIVLKRKFQKNYLHIIFVVVVILNAFFTPAFVEKHLSREVECDCDKYGLYYGGEAECDCDDGDLIVSTYEYEYFNIKRLYHFYDDEYEEEEMVFYLYIPFLRQILYFGTGKGFYTEKVISYDGKSLVLKNKNETYQYTIEDEVREIWD